MKGPSEGIPHLSLEGPPVTRTGEPTPAIQRIPKALAIAVLLCGAASAAAAQTRLESFRIVDEPRVSERVIRQSEWASELVFALGLSDALPDEPADADVFGLLCAEQSERTLVAGGLMAPAGAPYRVAVHSPPDGQRGEPVRMVISVPGTAIYALTVTGVGGQRWTIDRQVVGHLNASALGVAQAPRVVALRAGPHELAGYLAHDARVDQVELSAYRPLCIAPASGWRGHRPLSFASIARTLVVALGLERHLPIVALEPPVEGESFESASAWGGRTNRNLAQPASSGAWATAVDSPAEFAYRAHTAKPGTWSLMARIHGADAQIWQIDGYRVSVEPQSQIGDLDPDGFGWVHVMTRHLDAGDHRIRALVPRGAGIDELRFARRGASDADFIAVLEDAGFSMGIPAQPVTQTAAYTNLSNPLFAELASRLRERLAGAPGPVPPWVRGAEIDALEAAPPAPEL